jgi:hypothetical protein
MELEIYLGNLFLALLVNRRLVELEVPDLEVSFSVIEKLLTERVDELKKNLSRHFVNEVVDSKNLLILYGTIAKSDSILTLKHAESSTIPTIDDVLVKGNFL